MSRVLVRVEEVITYEAYVDLPDYINPTNQSEVLKYTSDNELLLETDCHLEYWVDTSCQG